MRFARYGRWIVSALAIVGVAAYLGYGIVHYLYNSSSSGDIPFVADFEAEALAPWERAGAVQLCCPHSFNIVRDPVRAGRGAARFEVTDRDPVVKGAKRSELRLKAPKLGEELWYAFSTFIPVDWGDDESPVTVAQWHAVPDVIFAEAGRPPPLRLAIVGDEWLIASLWDRRWITGTWMLRRNPQGGRAIWSGPLDRGRWIDWVFRVRWSYGADGVLAVWKDGEAIYSGTGANAYNDMLAPYLKLGLYIPKWRNPAATGKTRRRVIFFDEVRVLRQPGL